MSSFRKIQQQVTKKSNHLSSPASRRGQGSYDASVYDFNVQMQVEMTKAGNLLVPALIRYVGNWKVIFKKRERGIFTATLYDFNTRK